MSQPDSDVRASLANALRHAETLPFPDMIAASFAAYAPYHERFPYAGISVTRDARYGDDPRHRLDIYRADRAAMNLPVVLFVHGGGFVGGDKTSANAPFNDNISVWSARNGFIGVNMTYRLAPAARYPAGGDDVAAAIAWLRANIASFGGDPETIVLFGQSAGAAHAATFVAEHAQASSTIAGLVLLSGVYDFSGSERPPNETAYIGERSPDATRGVARAGIPLMLGISEFDPPMFHRQAKAMIDAWFAAHQALPYVIFFPEHNHISQIAHLNARDIGDTQLADALGPFVRRCAAQRVAP